MFASVSNEVFWNRIARKYAQDPISDIAGYERTLQRTKLFLSATDRVLEFGCGTGSTAFRLAPCVKHLVATDVSSEMIAIAHEKAKVANIANVYFGAATLEQPELTAESFDAVLGFNILHLLEDVPQALKAIHRYLKPGGMFISKTPCLNDANVMIRLAIPPMRWIGKAPFVKSFSHRELEQLVSGEGFEILESGKHGTKGMDFRHFIAARKRD